MMTRLWLLPERHPGRVITAIGLLFVFAYTASLIVRPKPDGRIVIGDALHHYVQLRSAVFDGDLHFRNDYIRLYGLAGNEPGTEWVYEDTRTGHVRSLMPVGPAILWAPLFLVVALFTTLANALGAAYPVDGFGRLFQATAGISGVLAATVGVWLSYRTCRLLFGARPSAWGCLVLWGGSSAIYYSLVSPTYSHAASLLASSAFWYAWVRTREEVSLRRYVMLGALAGVAALMRWQDAILLVPIALELLVRAARRTMPMVKILLSGLAAVAAAALAFTPQMMVWTTLYGRPLAMPQGEGFMKWSEPALLLMLFSDNHGLFTWTPIVAAAVAGLVFLARRDRGVALAAVCFLLLSWYVNAAVADWWAGEAFGARRFLSAFPVFALGLAALIDRWSPTIGRLVLAGGAVVAHTFLLLLQYQLFMHGLRDLAPYPAGAYGLGLARFVVPFDLLKALFAP